jgi:glycosyltransferase involved in cell wall biosynthesis
MAYEHLIQDAQSTDGTPDWLAEQHLMDSALLPVSEGDAGMYDAINRAWSRSRGQYLSWLNSDEQYLPSTLARVEAFFTEHPDVDAIFGDYLVVDDRGSPVALRREIPLRSFYVINSFLNTQSCTLFFRRRLWDAGLLQFDIRYRYAADKDLILKLVAAGVKIQHVPEVLSLFGVDGTNLSTHAGMHEEAETIRLAYGAFHFKPLRKLPVMARHLERLLRGAYWPGGARYRFATDEFPSYSDFEAKRISGRYTLASST